MHEITQQLIANKDIKNALFVIKLTPQLSSEAVLGVKNPIIKSIVKWAHQQKILASFRRALPHQYHEENVAHGYSFAYCTNVEEQINEIEKFLPFINNWGVCDVSACSLKIKDKKAFLPYLEKWITSQQPYTVRYAIVVLLAYYIEPEYIAFSNNLVKNVQSEDYYVMMAQAWYFSVALVKEYEKTIKIMRDDKPLSLFVHNKTIQKACESRRIPEDIKEILKGLKKGKNEKDIK